MRRDLLWLALLCGLIALAAHWTKSSAPPPSAQAPRVEAHARCLTSTAVCRKCGKQRKYLVRSLESCFERGDRPSREALARLHGLVTDAGSKRRVFVLGHGPEGRRRAASAVRAMAPTASMTRLVARQCNLRGCTTGAGGLDIAYRANGRKGWKHREAGI